ncbi:DUF255 domain-containing protein [Bacillus licheniformis]|nr:DUF255 domain-containing protein [Bacillus licheniformis]
MRTCHWCHVMAHESFEDEEVAKLLNESIITGRKYQQLIIRILYYPS